MLTLLLDGECTLCSHFGIWVAWLDIHHLIYFATQQSNTGQELMTEYGCEKEYMKSIIVLNAQNKTYYTKSRAILEILWQCHWLFMPLVLLGFLIPWFIRDFIYDFVSARRHKWFGTQACARPPSYYRIRVLDLDDPID